MRSRSKFLTGLAAVLGLGILYHGPAGGGERFARQLEAEANAAAAATGLPGLSVALQRDPLSRVAVVSGEADPFQREGMGSLKGVNDHVGEVDGIAAVRWTDEPERGGVPLLAETLLLLVLAYAAGFGLGWLLFGRKRREGFLS